MAAVRHGRGAETMKISTQTELEAAKEVLRKYNFVPGRSVDHPLQRSLEVLADAVEAYQYHQR